MTDDGSGRPGEGSGRPGEGSGRVPAVTVRPAVGDTRAVVLVLPGGKATSYQPSRRWHLSVLRMIPFAHAISRIGAAHGMAVWTLRYRFRGWNDEQAAPVSDANWALREVRRRHGDVPVILVGHSMGGRTALRAANDPAVRGVVALAPWLPAGEPVEGVRDRSVLIAHGTRDRWTDPRGSLDFALRARSVTPDLRRVEIDGVGHTMLRRAALWHGLTTYFVAKWLSDQSNLHCGANVPQKVATTELRLLI